MAETPVLQVEHLTMRYGEGCPHCKDHLEKNRCTVCGTVWAANDISLEVYPGEVLGIVGESGSGKSTLMQSLYFDLIPTEGKAYCRITAKAKRISGTQVLWKKEKSATISWVWYTRILSEGCGWTILPHLTLRKKSLLPAAETQGK